MDELTLALLGSVAASYANQPLLNFPTKASQALLIYLACQRAPCTRERLMALLWPELPLPSAQGSLRQNLYLLRLTIPNLPARSGAGSVPAVLADRHSVQIHPNARYHLDVDIFDELVAKGQSHWKEAIALYRGDFLADFYLPNSTPFEEWAHARRAHLRSRYLDVLAQLADQALAAGKFAEAGDYARRQLELDNLRECAHRQLMLALHGLGQRSAALMQYEACCEILLAELGVEPGDETKQLAERIRWGDSGVATRSTTASLPPCAHNLPYPATRLIGRERELEVLSQFISTDHSRLVTITGEGGIGKTRLALEVAHQFAAYSPCPFPDGIYFVSLAALADPAFVVSTLTTVLGLPSAHADVPPLRRQLLDWLKQKRILLLLDNFDDLLEEALLIGDILQEAPDVQILVTSRERLRLRSEQLLPLEGLRYDGDQAKQPAAELFVEAARRKRPDFILGDHEVTHLRRLCRLVEGMPLALELAATLVALMPLSDIAAQVEQGLDVLSSDIRDLPQRHRSMRAAFDASWQHMSPHEQTLLAALSVFRGGFSRRGGEEVVSATLAALAQLADRSLIHFDQQRKRYACHELVRQYATERLEATPEHAAQTRGRHMRHFLQLAQEIEEQLRTVARHTWLDSLDAERDNLRAALGWAVASGDWEALALMSGALGIYWGIRGHLNEGHDWLSLALEHREQVSDAAAAGVLFALGWLSFERGDYAAARQYYHESHSLGVSAGDTGRVAGLLSSLAHVAQQEGDLTAAERLCGESLTLFQGMEDGGGIAFCLNRLGRLAELQGKYDDAERLLRQSLRLREEVRDERGVASSLNSLAELARFRGDYGRARRLYERSLAICSQLADKRCVAGLNHNLAYVALNSGELQIAASHLRESLTLYRELDNGEGMALCLAGFGAVCLLSGDPAAATVYLSVAARQLQQMDVVLTAADQATYESNLVALQSQMDARDFDVAWSQGQAISVEAAVSLALEVADADGRPAS